jgi:SAM-dependent methyltransferase
MKEDQVKEIVRKGYAKIAKTERSCCTPTTSKGIGYSEAELNSVPEGADLNLGCGNPVAIASLKEGEIVIDLGSGGGLDCFLAANKVGEKGKVIGVDMTPEMVDKARENLRKSKHRNIELRLGEIENLPVADNTGNVVISNCVINLSPDKRRVFEEAFRVLRPGGRLMISDIVLLRELPERVKRSVQAYIGCIAGAVKKERYLELIEEAGFQDVRIMEEIPYPIDFAAENPTSKGTREKAKTKSRRPETSSNSIASIKVYGLKPR